MNKNVPKNGQNIAISFKFHKTEKLIVQWIHVKRGCAMRNEAASYLYNNFYK